MSAPKPFLATVMGGLVVIICTFIVVAGGFVLLLVNSANH